MSDSLAIVAGSPPAERDTACKVLDACSSPIKVREIEALLRSHGIPKSRATKLAGTLKGFHIITLVGPEADDV
jgi:hypothetical protein